MEQKEYDSTKAAFVRSDREKLIRMIQSVLARKEGTPAQTAEISLRLASLYFEEYHQLLLQTTSAPSAEATSYLHRSRALYFQLAKEFPNHPRRDEMLYSIGIGYFDENKIEDGIHTFETLSKSYPKSRYLNDADIEVGDYYFSKNQFDIAKKEYSSVIHRNYMPLITYAYYKTAWCFYNTGNIRGSLSDFKRALSMEKYNPSKFDLRVRAEAANDISLPYVDLGLIDEGMTLYHQLGEPYVHTGIEAMAYRLQEKGDYSKSIALWNHLIRMNDTYKNNSDYDLKIIEAFILENKTQNVVAHIEASAPLYIGRSRWTDFNTKTPNLLQQAQSNWERIIRKYALLFHAEGQKVKNEERYKTAADLYQLYLKYLPNTDFSPDARFNLAEIYRKDNRNLLAASYYVQAYETLKKPKQKEESLRLAVGAVGDDESFAKNKPPKSFELF